MEITVEVSCCKHPPRSQLSQFWNDNKQSLIQYLQQVHRGVKGVVRDGQTERPIVNAEVQIIGREVFTRSTNRGEYWRILMPGDYVIEVRANGYVTVRRQFTVTDGKVTRLNIWMYESAKPKRPTSEAVVFNRMSSSASPQQMSPIMLLSAIIAVRMTLS